MKLPHPFRLAALLLACAALLAACATAFKPEPGYVSLFNGKDLTGWGYRTNNFDGQTESNDGRYSAKDGILTVHPHTPRVLSKLSSTATLPANFSLKLEFRAETNADSGLFLRTPQLQVRDYLVAGPYTNLIRYKPQDWNEIEVTVRSNVAYCTCNGEVLEPALKLTGPGSIGLEGDRGRMEYRRIRLRELP